MVRDLQPPPPLTCMCTSCPFSKEVTANWFSAPKPFTSPVLRSKFSPKYARLAMSTPSGLGSSLMERDLGS